MEEEAEYFEAPDEVEVPLDQPARYRFIKYRGLQSFRSSPWDPKENLPVEYASLVEVENYGALQKHVAEEADERNTVGEEWTHELEDGTIVRDGLATIGSFIEVHVMGVSAAWVAQHAAAQPVLLSGLLPYEEKLTVMHSTFQRSSSWSPAPLKSRDLLVAHLGFRRVLIHPLFGDSGIRCDKLKYMKYVPPTGFVTCSFYAPLCFRPCPLLAFKPRQNNAEVGVVNGIET